MPARMQPHIVTSSKIAGAERFRTRGALAVKRRGGQAWWTGIHNPQERLG